MNKLLTIAISIYLIFGCNPYQESDPAQILAECMEDEDLILLNSLINKFEQGIMLKYERDLNTCYRNYLRDLADFKIPPSFFEETTLDGFKNSHLFKAIWIRESQLATNKDNQIIIIPPTEDSEETTSGSRYDPLIINPISNYLICLKNVNQTQAISSLLEINEQAIGVSPGLIARALNENLKVEDYEKSATRIAIAVNLHYDFLLKISER